MPFVVRCITHWCGNFFKILSACLCLNQASPQLNVMPSFESVYEFREAQEAALRARSDRAMTPAAVRRFIAHYERLTRRQLRRLPARADLVLRLAPDHALVAVTGPGIQG